MAKKKAVKGGVKEKSRVGGGFQLAGLAGTVMVVAFVVMVAFSGSADVVEPAVEATTRRVIPTVGVMPTVVVTPVRGRGNVKCLDTQGVCPAGCPMTRTANGCECVCNPAY